MIATLALMLFLQSGVAPALHDGDIIFHHSRSAQSEAIGRATHSPYTHMGIVFRRDGHWVVYEAVQPVKVTPLEAWIARGEDRHYVVKRLRDESVLTPAVLERMRRTVEQFRGRNYDLVFGWSDDRIYCSELVWKAYKRAAGVEIGSLQHLRDFDLSDAVVRGKLHERYGHRIPWDEPVISPAAMFASPLLREVARQ